MKPEYEAYGRAQAAVSDAYAAHEQAAVELAQASEPIADQIEAAWNANQRAVTDAKTAMEAAVVNLARVQAQASTSARARNRDRPVLNAEEKAHVDAAEAVMAEATEAHESAKQRFKDGVTAELLDDLDRGS